MIQIPESYKHSPFTDKNFRELVEFFNTLERNLQYPNCEGYADQERTLKNAQNDLTMWGKI